MSSRGPEGQPARVPLARRHRRAAQRGRDLRRRCAQGGGRMPAYARDALRDSSRHRAVHPRWHLDDGPRGQALALRSEVLARRRRSLHRSRWLPGHHAAVGDADGDRSGQGRHSPGRCRSARCPARASRTPAARTTAALSSPPAASCSSARRSTTTSSARSTRTRGRLLWEATLPAAGNATPAVYDVNGKEYVVIGAGGGQVGRPVRRHVRRLRATLVRDARSCRRRRRGVCGRRTTVADRSRLRAARSATPDGVCRRRRAPGRRRAARGGRHRHGQDARLPRSSDSQRPARPRLDGHEEPAGADRPEGSARAGGGTGQDVHCHGDERPRQLPLPPPVPGTEDRRAGAAAAAGRIRRARQRGGRADPAADPRRVGVAYRRRATVRSSTNSPRTCRSGATSRRRPRTASAPSAPSIATASSPACENARPNRTW